MHSNTQRHQVVNFKPPGTVGVLLPLRKQTHSLAQTVPSVFPTGSPSGYSTLQCDPQNNKTITVLQTLPQKRKSTTKMSSHNLHETSGHSVSIYTIFRTFPVYKSEPPLRINVFLHTQDIGQACKLHGFQRFLF